MTKNLWLLCTDLAIQLNSRVARHLRSNFFLFPCIYFSELRGLLCGGLVSVNVALNTLRLPRVTWNLGRHNFELLSPYIYSVYIRLVSFTLFIYRYQLWVLL